MYGYHIFDEEFMKKTKVCSDLIWERRFRDPNLGTTVFWKGNKRTKMSVFISVRHKESFNWRFTKTWWRVSELLRGIVREKAAIRKRQGNQFALIELPFIWLVLLPTVPVHLKNNAASFDLHSEMSSFDKQWIYCIEKVGKNGKNCVPYAISRGPDGSSICQGIDLSHIVILLVVFAFGS